MEYNIIGGDMMKKYLILLIIITFISFAKGSGGNDSSGSGSGTGTQTKEQTSQKSGTENTQKNYGEDEKLQLQKKENLKIETENHYRNIMKIMEKYKYTIKNEADYNEFCRAYENGELKNLDKETLNKLELEFKRYKYLE